MNNDEIIEQGPHHPTLIVDSYVQFTIWARTRIKCRVRPLEKLVVPCHASSSSSAFALAWRNYSPRSITPPMFYEHFCVPLWLGANWGYWPIVSPYSTREEKSITSYSCFSLLATGIGTRYKEPRFYISFEGREQSK
jgi:hypothetical protein